MDLLMIILFVVVMAFGFLVVSAITGKSLRYKHDSEPFATPDVIPGLIKLIGELFVDKNSPQYKIKILNQKLESLKQIDVINIMAQNDEAKRIAESNSLLNKYSSEKLEDNPDKIMEQFALEKQKKIQFLESEIELLKRQIK